MSEDELVSLDELRKRGQVIEHTTPNNVIENISCEKCGCNFSCTSDYRWHRKVGCGPKNHSKECWKKSKNGTCEWILAEKVPHIITAIREGHSALGLYTYWIYGDGKFVARRTL